MMGACRSAGRTIASKARDHLRNNHFVLRADVKSYYASIDQLLLLDQLAAHIKDRRVLNLIRHRRQYRRVHRYSAALRKTASSVASR
jgi:retron-type reverse transcriptase